MFFLSYGCDCGFGCRVAKVDEDLHLLNLRMRCPGCGQAGLEILDDSDLEKYGRLEIITAKSLFDASMGHGLPDQRSCSPDALKEIMLYGAITELDLQTSSANPHRSMISSMKVSKEGVEYQVYFATSTQGATVYKAVECK